MTVSTLPAADAASRLETGVVCTLCGEDLRGKVTAKEPNCPGCKARARTRTLPVVVSEVVAPLLEADRGLPLLAFAMTSSEEAVETRLFPNFVSASLFGNYRRGHLEGVDVRDLSRFAEGSFSGVSGVLLFDYFVEMEKALAECFRVLAPGGVFFTHIAPYRLLPGEDGPRYKAIIKKREGYFDYLPNEADMPSVLVARAWFLRAMQAAGFEVHHSIVRDTASGLDHDWFVGRKPIGGLPDPVSQPRGELPLPASVRLSALGLKPSAHRKVRPQIRTAASYTVALPPSTGLRRLRLEIFALDFEKRFQDTKFAEHVNASGGSEIVGLQDDAVLVSRDGGVNWEAFEYRAPGPIAFWNAFSPAGHTHRILQTRGWAAESDKRPEGPETGRLYLMEPSGVLVASGQCGSAAWHGSWSIDQSPGAVIFGEYHINSAKFRAKPYAEAGEEARRYLRSTSLFRSADGGMSWERVLEFSPDAARHIHTVVASRFEPGVWWASTGDKPSECKVFCSRDDGRSWREVSVADPRVPPPPGQPSRLQASYRATAVAETATDLRWGADDIYGDLACFDPALERDRRTGARFYVADKRDFSIREVAYCGHPVRSLVDVGAGYIAFTEAFYRDKAGRLEPEVKFWSKSDPEVVVPICSLENPRDASTGFTYSRASRYSDWGAFFTYKAPDVGVRGRPRILKWQVGFE